MKQPRVAVVDYGLGNLRSVANAVERSGMQSIITGDPGDLAEIDALVVPGAAAFADAIHNLRETGLADAIRESLARGRPYLGLCLGLQTLFEESDENGCHAGMALLRGRVEHFPAVDQEGDSLRVPHIGWNEVIFSGDHPMLNRLPERDYFYFVHSYYAVPNRPEEIVGRTHYGFPFASAVATEKIFAVQFHPEKSQGAGKRFLDAFRLWIGEV